MLTISFDLTNQTDCTNAAALLVHLRQNGFTAPASTPVATSSSSAVVEPANDPVVAETAPVEQTAAPAEAPKRRGRPPKAAAAPAPATPAPVVQTAVAVAADNDDQFDLDAPSEPVKAKSNEEWIAEIRAAAVEIQKVCASPEKAKPIVYGIFAKDGKGATTLSTIPPDCYPGVLSAMTAALAAAKTAKAA